MVNRGHMAHTTQRAVEPGPEVRVSRSDLITLFAIAAAVYSAADVIHEVCGHVLMCRITGVQVTLVSTIGVTTGPANRWVLAAGTSANVLTGAMALFAFRRRTTFDATAYFLWLFGAVSLMNVGYLMFSCLTGIGDWGVFIQGLRPLVVWRLLLGVVGYTGYVLVMLQSARLLAQRVSADEARRLTGAAYWIGAIVMTAAAALNPQGTRYVVISGIGASLALTVGLLRIPSLVRRRFATASTCGVVRRSVVWILVGTTAAIIFVGLIGRGIRVS